MTSPGLRQKRRNQKRRRKTGKFTYDGVTDEGIFERDGWTCMMPVCLCPDGRDIPREVPEGAPDGNSRDPWRASVDHVIRLAAGGEDNALNKRAAHAYCNAVQPDLRVRKGALHQNLGAVAGDKLRSLIPPLPAEGRAEE